MKANHAAGCPHLVEACGRQQLLKAYRASRQVALLSLKKAYLSGLLAESTSANAVASGLTNSRVAWIKETLGKIEKALGRQGFQCCNCQLSNGLFLCLHCLECHCMRSTQKNDSSAQGQTQIMHIVAHLKTHFESYERVERLQAVRAKVNRPLCSVFAVSVCDVGALYCYECKDLVWDKEFIAVNDEEKAWISSLLDQGFFDTPSIPFARPSLSTNLNPQQFRLTRCSGLRGLRNLGNTCYMNVILQSFIHNPALRGAFLSDGHRSNSCKQTPNSIVAFVNTNLWQFFGGETLPFSPTSFLYTSWKRQKTLAGAHQHDAHEFYMTLLWSMHMDLVKSKSTINQHPSTPTSHPCSCLAHQVFYGTQISRVVCTICGHVSETREEFGDISLGVNLKSGRRAVTLGECLRRHTAPEKCPYTCSRCARPVEATKQYSFISLPPVLSIQFKRFESSHNSSRKIETPVLYPTLLDMAPYVSPTTAHELSRPASPIHPHISASLHSQDSTTSPTTPIPRSSSNEPRPPIYYDLFCVVSHKGSLENGHYIAYARYRNEWVRFDDDLVTRSTEMIALNGEVLPPVGPVTEANAVNPKINISSSQTSTKSSDSKLPGSKGAYMLFYVRRDARVNMSVGTEPETAAVDSIVRTEPALMDQKAHRKIKQTTNFYGLPGDSANTEAAGFGLHTSMVDMGIETGEHTLGFGMDFGGFGASAGFHSETGLADAEDEGSVYDDMEQAGDDSEWEGE